MQRQSLTCAHHPFSVFSQCVISSSSPEVAESGSVDSSYAIRLATIGLLLQAVISFPSSAALPFFNRVFGITNWYHLCAIVYGLAVIAIGFVGAYYETLIIMSILGVAIPPIFSSSYILVEVYAAEADTDDSDDSDDSEDDDTSTDGTPRITPGITPKSTPRFTPTTAPETIPESPLEGHPTSSTRSADRRLAELRPPSRTDSGRGSPASVSSRRSNRGLPRGSPSEADDSEFTTATLEDKRGTITALFNITMICAQLVIGLTSGFLIDWIGNITVRRQGMQMVCSILSRVPLVCLTCGRRSSNVSSVLSLPLDRVLRLRCIAGRAQLRRPLLPPEQADP